MGSSPAPSAAPWTASRSARSSPREPQKGKGRMTDESLSRRPLPPRPDQRHHVRSILMRESLLDKGVMASTETPVVRMLPYCHVVKVGGRSILDGGKATTYPLVEALGA